MTQQLLLIELNEVNFDHIQHYCAQGKLPNFARLIDRFGVSRTVSESRYEELEPWIQWVTAHTGLSLAEHGVFRLGDIVKTDLPQIWEQLEQRGLRVGAISPMNAKNRLRQPAFFVPDPWTPTEITASGVLKRLHQAIAQAVNDNAQKKVTASTVLALLQGLLRYASPSNYGRYLALVLGARGNPWKRAIFLDLLLADVFMEEVRRARPDFATLFLNAAAHIQHHYMFCAAPYNGPHRNPDWYVPGGVDPVYEIYQMYDHVIGLVCSRFPGSRLMLATGLHQVPHSELTFYWRLKDHAAFLREIGVKFLSVEPRMSRDFIVRCEDDHQAQVGAARLSLARASDGIPLFEVDNRGTDLFVMLTYPREIGPGFTFGIGADTYTGLDSRVAFVALKNGKHDGLGYFLDTGAPSVSSQGQFPLYELPQHIAQAFHLRFDS